MQDKSKPQGKRSQQSLKNRLKKLVRWRPSLPALLVPPSLQPVPIPIRRDE
jgi:hypothetical protein